MHINGTNVAYDFSVKLSSRLCSHTDSSCLGCWLMIYLCMTNPALCNDKLVFKVSVLLAQARPRDDNHHTSYIAETSEFDGLMVK